MKYKYIFKIVLYAITVIIFSTAQLTHTFAYDETSIECISPSGNIKAVIKTLGSKLMYSIQLNGITVIEDSALGINVNDINLGENVTLGQPVSEILYEQYATRGTHDNAINHCILYKIPVTDNNTKAVFELQARAYDDGFAYRYIIERDDRNTVKAESSSWKIPEGSQVWYFERNSSYKLKTYAGEWVSTSIDNLPTISTQGPIQGCPLVVHLPTNAYAVITEAALYNYSGMRLEAISDRTVRANFTEGSNGFSISGNITTPWRVTMISDNLNDLVNNDLITNLNPEPSQDLYADTSYIKPGRSVWRWWSIGTGTFEEEKQFIDYAAQLGFEYTLVDDGWEAWSDCWTKVKALCDYGKSKNVGVFLWKNSSDIISTTNNYENTRNFFVKAKETGAVGLKIDFMDSESKDKIDFENNALIIAAQNSLMIDFHGCTKPTGESRTYPNEITREGIRGLELNKMGEFIPASHNAALPYTRFLLGHGDYTPLGYSNPGVTSFAHQLATVIAFTSPLQVLAENPNFLLNDKSVSPALEMLKSIPTTWDETRIISGTDIGKLSIMARRKGEIWFISILNGSNTQTNLGNIDLTFLDNSPYKLTVLTSPTQKTFDKKESVINGNCYAMQNITLGGSDGLVASLVPITSDNLLNCSLSNKDVTCIAGEKVLVGINMNYTTLSTQENVYTINADPQDSLGIKVNIPTKQITFKDAQTSSCILELSVNDTAPSGTYQIPVTVTDSGGAVIFSDTITLNVVYDDSEKLLFEDDFENGTGKWAVKTGSWSIATSNGSNKYKSPDSGTAETFAGDVNWTDFVVTAKMNASSGNNGGIIFRAKDANNYYYYRLSKPEKKVQLYKVVNGSPSIVTEADFDWNYDTEYELKVVVIGNTAKFYVNGTLKCSYTNPAIFANGKIGFRTYILSATFDDVKVCEVDYKQYITLNGGDLSFNGSGVILSNITVDYSGSPIECNIIYALYSTERKCLVDSKSKTLILNGGAQTLETENLTTDPGSNCYIKVILLNNLQDIKPYCKNLYFGFGNIN